MTPEPDHIQGPAPHGSRRARAAGRTVAAWVWTVGAAAAIVALALFPVKEPDIYWHLCFGDMLLRDGHLPAAEPLTFTVPPTVPMVSTQWFFQALAAAVYRTAGWDGLVALRVTLVLALAHAAAGWLRRRGHSRGVVAVAVVLAVAAIRPRLFTRPELLALPVAVHLMAWLDPRADTGGGPPGGDGVRGYSRCGLDRLIGTPPAPRWWIVPLALQMAWANVHSSCALGVLVALVHGGRMALARGGAAGLAAGAAFAGAMAAVTGLNPNGFMQPLYALTEGQRTFITELRPPGWDLPFSAAGIALAVGVLGYGPAFVAACREHGWPRWILSPLRHTPQPNPWSDTGQVGILWVYLFQSLRQVRFYPHLVLAAVPGIGLGVARLARLRRVGLALPAAVAVAAAVVAVRGDDKSFLRAGVDESPFPVSATTYIKSFAIPGLRVFQSGDDGGYMAWRLGAGHVAVYHETRLNADLLDKLSANRTADGLRAIVDGLGADVAVLPLDTNIWNKEGRTVAAMFSAWPDWPLVWWDDTHAVFLKRGGRADAFIGSTLQYRVILRFLNRARRADIFTPPRADAPGPNGPCVLQPELLPGPGGRPAPPRDAAAFSRMATDPATRARVGAELRRAARASPRNFRAALGLALWMEQGPEAPDALLWLYRAATLEPRSANALMACARWHFRFGRPSEGLGLLRRAADIRPDDPDVLCNLAIGLKQSGRAEESAAVARRALKIDPRHAGASRLAQ